jgi:hypothetical protein
MCFERLICLKLTLVSTADLSSRKISYGVSYFDYACIPSSTFIDMYTCEVDWIGILGSLLLLCISTSLLRAAGTGRFLEWSNMLPI